MTLTVIGLNHKTAPLEIRESLTVPRDLVREIYNKILSCGVSEALVLSTCNRVEYYFVTRAPLSKEGALNLFAKITGLDRKKLAPHLFIHCATDAVKHLMQVSAGIDSLVLGEPQIFGQVKSAFKDSRQAGAVKVFLNKLEQALNAGVKKIRSSTGISANAVSVSYAAVSLAKKIFGSFAGRSALIIGAGQMCELAAKHLYSGGLEHIFITNRTASAAAEMANRFRGKTVDFAEFSDALINVDIVISSTGAQNILVDKPMVAKVMKQRRNAPIFFIDIAVPRDIGADVAELDNVYVYDMDDLEQVVDTNSVKRRQEALKASRMVEMASESFEESIRALKAVPVIKEIKKLANMINDYELEKYCKKNGITCPDEIGKLERLINGVTAKLLHSPLEGIKRLAGKDERTVDMFAELFDISTPKEEDK